MHPCSAPSKSAAPSITAVIPKTSVAVPIAVEEARVQIQTAAEPSTPPSPASPVGVIGAHVVSRTESESETVARRVPQVGVFAPHRPAPDVRWAVGGDIDHLRIGRLNLDRIPAFLCGSRHHLLRRVGQLAVGPGTSAHPLYRAHHISSAGQGTHSQDPWSTGYRWPIARARWEIPPGPGRSGPSSAAWPPPPVELM